MEGRVCECAESGGGHRRNSRGSRSRSTNTGADGGPGQHTPRPFGTASGTANTSATDFGAVTPPTWLAADAHDDADPKPTAENDPTKDGLALGWAAAAAKLVRDKEEEAAAAKEVMLLGAGPTDAATGAAVSGLVLVGAATAGGEAASAVSLAVAWSDDPKPNLKGATEGAVVLPAAPKPKENAGAVDAGAGAATDGAPNLKAGALGAALGAASGFSAPQDRHTPDESATMLRHVKHCQVGPPGSAPHRLGALDAGSGASPSLLAALSDSSLSVPLSLCPPPGVFKLGRWVAEAADDPEATPSSSDASSTPVMVRASPTFRFVGGRATALMLPGAGTSVAAPKPRGSGDPSFVTAARGLRSVA
jgi:hypothetical protein